MELVGIHDGAVRLRLHTSSHGCGSTAKNLQSIVEESIYDLAPDMTSLRFSDLDDERSSGFVPLESLLRHPLPVPVLAAQARNWKVPIEISPFPDRERLTMPTEHPRHSIRHSRRFGSSPARGPRPSAASSAAPAWRMNIRIWWRLRRGKSFAPVKPAQPSLMEWRRQIQPRLQARAVSG